MIYLSTVSEQNVKLKLQEANHPSLNGLMICVRSQKGSFMKQKERF